MLPSARNWFRIVSDQNLWHTSDGHGRHQKPAMSPQGRGYKEAGRSAAITITGAIGDGGFGDRDSAASRCVRVQGSAMGVKISRSGRIARSPCVPARSARRIPHLCTLQDRHASALGPSAPISAASAVPERS